SLSFDRMGRINDAKRLYGVLKILPEVKANPHLAAKVYLELGFHDLTFSWLDRVRDLEKLRSRLTSDADSWNRASEFLGLALLRNGESDKALSVLSEAR